MFLARVSMSRRRFPATWRGAAVFVSIMIAIGPWGAASARAQARSALAAESPGSANRDPLSAAQSGANTTTLAAAVLPTSRAVTVGVVTATAFATVINAGAVTAINCSIAPPTGLPARFGYQITDPATNQLTGTANTPVNIPVGGLQTFLVAIMPLSAFGTVDVAFSFSCANAPPAPVISGVNTLLLTASTSPGPDVVALASTLNNDGIVTVPGGATGVFAVATVNVGAAGLRIAVSSDTGSASLPVSVLLCETNPSSGQCISDLGPMLFGPMGAGSTFTFAIFVKASGPVPFDPAANRIFVRFTDPSGTTRGATSVAVRTQ